MDFCDIALGQSVNLNSYSIADDCENFDASDANGDGHGQHRRPHPDHHQLGMNSFCRCRSQLSFHQADTSTAPCRPDKLGNDLARWETAFLLTTPPSDVDDSEYGN